MGNFHGMFRALTLVLGVVIAASAEAGHAFGQDTGQIYGRVVDSEGGRPLRGVELAVVGTSIRTRTDARGRYRLARVPAGTAELLIALPGFTTIRETWDVPAGAALEIDFELIPFAGVLRALVAEAPRTAPARGADGVVRIERAEIEASTAANVAELLRGVPGLSIHAGSGQIGSGGQLRIRGPKSLTLSNAPIVVLDGGRIHATRGGQESLLQVLYEMPLGSVQRIEVLRGAAAAAAYGPETAAGVILIYTGRRERL